MQSFGFENQIRESEFLMLLSKKRCENRKNCIKQGKRYRKFSLQDITATRCEPNQKGCLTT